MNLKEKLNELKESRGWNNEDLAIKLDVSLNTVKSWNRKKKPSTPNKWIMKEINELLRTSGIDRILPTKIQVDELLKDPEVYKKVAEAMEQVLDRR